MWNMLRVASSGLQAQQRALDVSANNLANTRTTGFKSRRVNLVDVKPAEATFGTPGNAAPAQVGEGVDVGAILPNWAPGSPMPSEHPLDVAIAGDGFLQVTLPDGRTAYTRDGAIRVDADGQLGIGPGRLNPPIALPPGAANPAIAPNGQVTAEITPGDRQVIGQIELARFPNPDGLEATGENMFVATPAAGAPVVGAPGADGLGALVPGHLESANVDAAEELVRVMTAQRAYSINLRLLRTADELLQEAANLRR